MRRIKFAEYELDMDLFTLRRNGEKLEIGKRTFDLLICLIENRERVVDQESLRREVWHSATLSPAAIPTCVRELRLTLADTALDPRFIASIRGRGYRFISEVERAPRSRRNTTQPLEDLPFVGRGAEMAVLRNVLRSSVAEARGHLVLIRGEAGMGKTRLLAEFFKTVPTTIPTFVARSSAIEGTPAFWPWTKILRDALEAQNGVNQKLIENAAALSTAFPEIQRSVGPASLANTDLDRFSILSRWTATIRCMSRGAPLLLAFEDLHLADFDTLSLVAWVAEEFSFDPVTVIATHRPHGGNKTTAQGLAELASLSRCKNIDLAPLTALDIKSMLDPLRGDKQELSKELETRTAGNAFYVTHLIRILDSRDEVGSADSLVSSLPSDGRAIVSRQLSDLPVPTRYALAVASVWGGSFPVAETAEVIGLTNSQLLTRLDAARRAWLIREDGSKFVFNHSLLREALYRTLDSADRRAIHLRVSEVLIRRGDAHVALISDHQHAAAPLVDLEEARKFALLAGRDAAARFSFSEAQVFFQRAVGDVGLAPGCNAADHCRALLEYANSQLYSGDREAARKTLLTAATVARTTTSSSLLAECALQLAPDFLAIEIGAYDSQLISLLQEALTELPVGMNSTRSQLLARLSHALLWSKDVADSEQIAVDALRLARKSGEIIPLRAALAARADSLTGPDRLPQRMEITKELEGTLRTKSNLPDAVMQHVRLIATLLELGDIRAVDSEIASCEQIALKTNLPQYLWYTKSFRAMRTLMKGDFAETHRLARESHELGGKHGDENVPHSRACQTACIRIEQNNAAASLSTISAMATKRPLVRAWAAGTGYIQLVSGNLSEARHLLESFDAKEIDILFRETGGSAGIAFLAEISALCGDSDRKTQLMELCNRSSSRGATLGFAIAYFGCFSRYSGILAQSLGANDEAIEHLTTAVDVDTKRGAVIQKAHAELDLALALLTSETNESEVYRLLSSVKTVCDDSPFYRVSDRADLLSARISIEAGTEATPAYSVAETGVRLG